MKRKTTKPISQAETASQFEPLLLDIKGAAHALSTTTWAVCSLLWEGKIPYLKIGRKFLIDPADLRAFISREKAAA
jgi:excisionase family DNA binding protein